LGQKAHRQFSGGQLSSKFNASVSDPNSRTSRLTTAETYRAKAAEYECLATTAESPFRDALLDVAEKWRTMANDVEIGNNANRAFAERLRWRLGLLCL
jgi:hypothetical protein